MSEGGGLVGVLIEGEGRGGGSNLDDVDRVFYFVEGGVGVFCAERHCWIVNVGSWG